MKAGMQFDSRQIYSPTTLLEFRMPISLAKNEICRLHGVVASLEPDAAGTSMRAYFSLKSARNDGAAPPEGENELMGDKHTFWKCAHRIEAGYLNIAKSFWLGLDPGIVMIREPRIIFISGAQNGYINSFWYYTKEKIGDRDLTSFMVKKHH